MNFAGTVLRSTLLGLWFLPLLLPPTRAEAWGDDPPQLSDIRGRYHAQPEKLRQLAVDFLFSSRLHAEPGLVKQFDHFWGPVDARATFAFKGPKLFYDQRYAAVGGRPGIRKVLAFDGRVTYLHEEEGPLDVKGNASVRIMLGNHVGKDALDVFMGYHGFPRIGDSIFFLDDMEEPASTSLLDTLDDEDCKVAPGLNPCGDGTPCVLVEADRERIWLDPSLNLALRQREWTGPGDRGVITRIRFENHVEVEPGIWLARTIRRDCFCDPSTYPALAGTPYRTETIEASEIRSEPVPDELFAFSPPAGTFVNDLTKIPVRPSEGFQRIVTYTVPASPLSVDEVARKATEEAIRAAENPGSGWASTKWFILAHLVAITAVIVVFALRMKRRNEA